MAIAVRKMCETPVSSSSPSYFDGHFTRSSSDSNGELQSEELLVKCPSKYEGEEEDTGVSHIFLAAMAIAVLGIGYLVITMFYRKS